MHISFVVQTMSALLRILITIGLIIASQVLVASDPNLISAKMRVYKNDLDKIYTVFFADTAKHDISVLLKDSRGSVINEQSFSSTGFSKKYSLSELKNGEYSFVVTFEGVELTEPIRLKSEKEILAESIQLEQNYPTLKIHIKLTDLSPINIHVYDMKDKLQKVFYWEPNENFLTKEIDISQFEGYELRVEVIQEEIQKIDRLINLY